MRRILIIGLLSCWILGLVGCACLKESAKGFLAISTTDIEESRGQALVKIVDYGYENCYGKVEEILTEIGSYIYAKRKDLIAVYVSSTDTTPAGIFFKEINGHKTRLEVASPAKDTKEYLARKIFSALEKQQN
ncbi:MAG: hypothetical protein ABIH40_01030 [Candidatus Omnitrophota bacterium]